MKNKTVFFYNGKLVNCRYEFHGKRGDLSLWAKYIQLTISKQWSFVAYERIPNDSSKIEILEYFNDYDFRCDYDSF